LRESAVSAGTLSPVQQDAGDEETTSLRQRVAELEQLLRASKTDVSVTVNGEETGQFILRARH